MRKARIKVLPVNPATAAQVRQPKSSTRPTNDHVKVNIEMWLFYGSRERETGAL
jgi:hypothetical protein